MKILRILTDPTNWSDIPKRKDWHLAAAAFAIGAVGYALRLWAFLQGLAQEPFWYDEAFTWLASGRPLPQLIAATAGDVHPPLFYLLLHWFRPAPQEMARLLPLAFSLAGLWLFWQVLKTLPLKTSTRLLALALMALAPQQIHYANELRMYSLLQALGLLQLLAVRRRAWWFWALASVAAMYTHNYGLVYTALTGLLALAGELRRPVRVPPQADWPTHYAPSDAAQTRPLIACGLLAAACYIPWAAVLYKQLQFVNSGLHWLQPLNFSTAVDALYTIAVGAYLPGAPNLVLYSAWTIGAVIAAAIAIRGRQWMLLYWAFGAWLLAIAISLVTPMLLYRALLPVTGGVYALLAYALTSSGRRGLIGAAALAAVLLVSLGAYVGMVETGRAKMRHYDPRADLGPGLVVHIEDDTLITYAAQPQARAQHVMLDACPDQIAALGPAVRNALGLRTLPLRALPERYTLAVTLGPFSNRCQEELLAQLTAGRDPVKIVATDYVTAGIWSIEE